MLIPKRVLFVCTGNTCRSPMAAGLVNFFLDETWQAFSAGVAPGTGVNPNSVAVLAELGIDITDHTPRPTSAYQGRNFAVVITLGEYPHSQFKQWAEIETLQLMDFPDPYGQSVAIYRQTRDAIRAKVLLYLENK